MKRADVPIFDPKEVKQKMKQSLDLQVDMPMFDPSSVSRPYQNPTQDQQAYIPGTAFREPTTKPKDDPRERPGGLRATTAPY